ncbi:hypothetical protein HYT52_05110 [Candidatus Woesearchaeota archaeon]|nr:hypothetical protein [Candidatus Woesearchaeota archaeon]
MEKQLLLFCYTTKIKGENMTYMTRLASTLYAGALASALLASACMPVKLTPMDIRKSYDGQCVGIGELPALVNGENNPALARMAGMNRARADYLRQCVPEASRSRVEDVPLKDGKVTLRYSAASVLGLETDLDRGFAVARPGSDGIQLEWVLADGQDALVQLIEKDRQKAEPETKPAVQGEKSWLDKAKDKAKGLVEDYNPFK